MGLLGPVMIIVWKDVLLELRSRDLIISVVVFGLLVVVVFNFALNNTPGRSEELAPGILWAAFAFAAVLAMNRAFVRDQEQGGLEGLLISPVSRDAIFLGKALTSLIFMLLVEAALLPVYAVMLDFSALSWTLMLTIFLGTLALGDEARPMPYGRDLRRDMAGFVERIGEARWRLVLPFPGFQSTLDVMEIVPA